jgi:hypothetical protein
VKEQGEDTPTRSESSGEVEEEREVTPPLLSPPRITLPPFNDIADRLMWVAVGVRQPKQNQTGTRLSTGLPQQPHPMSVTSDMKGMSILLVLTERNYLSRISQVPLGSAVAAATKPPPKKARSEAHLRVSSRYVWCCLSLTWFLLLLSSFLNSKRDFRMTRVVPWLLQSLVNWLRTRRLTRT